MNKLELFVSRVAVLLAKLGAVLTSGKLPSVSEVAYFETCCDALFDLRMAPNHALRIQCIRFLEAYEAAKAVAEAKQELFNLQKAAALEAAAKRSQSKRELWLAGKAEADAKAKARKAAKPAVRLAPVKGGWRVKGAVFSKSETAELEAALLAPRAEAE